MQKIVSPGVYTQENDLSFLPQGATNIGCAFVGAFNKGTGMVPTKITGQSTFTKLFGNVDSSMYTTYAVQQYLKYNDTGIVVRTMWNDGYKSDVVTLNSGSTIYAIFASTDGNVGNTSNSLSITSFATGSAGAFNLSLSGSKGTMTVSCSNLTQLADVVSREPKQTTIPAYLYYLDSTVTTASITVTASKSANQIDFYSNSTDRTYKNASTPYITSNTGVNLFKFYHISDGEISNNEIKIGVSNIKVGTNGRYSSFDVVVRDITDTDSSVNVLESFTNLDLDPTSDNYICKVIGDRYPFISDNKILYNGDYTNKSSYIRVAVVDDVKNQKLNANVYPIGFKGMTVPVNYGTGSLSIASSSAYVYSTSSVKQWYGFNFNSTNLYKNFAHSVYSSCSNTIADFTMGSTSVSATPTSYKFLVPLQGGFDGTNPAKLLTSDTNTIMGFDVSTATSSGVTTYKTAIDLLQNSDQFDINLISIPGINIQATGKKEIANYAIEMCQAREDCMVVFDVAEQNTINVKTVSAKTQNLDTNYGACYFPYVKMKDSYNKKFVWLPASTLIPAVFAYNDKVSQPFYAPAGLNRGVLFNVIEAKIKLNQADRDTLYQNRINPLATFPGEGVVVWGQKTLQYKASALDRINVRRLLIKIKKYFVQVGRRMLFDNNTTTLRNTFLGIVNPYLDNIVTQNGLYAYKIVMDETNNTPDIIDRNMLVGEVWLQPTKTAQFIVIPFNIQRTGA